MRKFLRSNQDKRRRSSVVPAFDPAMSRGLLSSSSLCVPATDSGTRRNSMHMTVPEPTAEVRYRSRSFSGRTTSTITQPPADASRAPSTPTRPRRPVAGDERRFQFKRMNTGIELRKESLYATLAIIALLIVMVTVTSHVVKWYWDDDDDN